jgi:UDP-N-acetylmuramoyl-tripeptide--D-alanyl-D-alanine ligase
MAVTEIADGVTIVDDSYNANPESMRAALKALVSLAGERRTIAVLGEMRELGEDSLAQHDALGRLAVRLDVSRLVVVGRGARAMYTGALLEGSFGEEAAFVSDIDEAQRWLADNVLPGDVVLLKSSNGSGLHLLADRLLGEGR